MAGRSPRDEQERRGDILRRNRDWEGWIAGIEAIGDAGGYGGYEVMVREVPGGRQ